METATLAHMMSHLHILADHATIAAAGIIILDPATSHSKNPRARRRASKEDETKEKAKVAKVKNID